MTLPWQPDKPDSERRAWRVGSLLAGASKSEQDAVRRYARLLGICHQMADDLLDPVVAGTGKDAGANLRHGRDNYATLLGCVEARQLSEQRLGEAIGCLPQSMREDPLLTEPVRSLLKFAS